MNILSGRTKACDLSSYPYSIKEWFTLSEEIENAVSYRSLKQQFSIL